MPTTEQIPAAPAIDDPELRAAYWDALALNDAGWQLRRLRYVPFTDTGIIDAHTPTHRAITITTRTTLRHLPAHLPGTGNALRLAGQVAALGKSGDRVDDLAWLITGSLPPARTIPPRRDPIPDPALTRQPSQLRIAFWLLATLVCDYSWHISHLGEDLAGGGFIADIPHDVTAVYPASAPIDGTAAAALARLIPALPGEGLQYLRHASTAALARAQAHAGRS
jgi:hypothetical protein